MFGEAYVIRPSSGGQQISSRFQSQFGDCASFVWVGRKEAVMWAMGALKSGETKEGKTVYW